MPSYNHDTMCVTMFSIMREVKTGWCTSKSSWNPRCVWKYKVVEHRWKLFNVISGCVLVYVLGDMTLSRQTLSRQTFWDGPRKLTLSVRKKRWTFIDQDVPICWIQANWKTIGVDHVNSHLSPIFSPLYRCRKPNVSNMPSNDLLIRESIPQ